jgi:molybdate transport system substrate-binding protein
MKKGVGLFIIFVIGLAGCSEQDSQTMTISAASSLHPALTSLSTSFEKTHPGIDLELNFGSSGALDKQIERGAPVDVFLSADVRLVSNPVVFAHNKLVVIVPIKSERKIDSLVELASSDIQKIAIGRPELVPAGKYAEQCLKTQRQYKKIEPKLIPVSNVRQVLGYVESGAVDAGFVYLTDAHSSNRVRIENVVSSELHDAITYAGEVTMQAKNKRLAHTFLTYIMKDESARAILEKNGFLQ